MLSSLSQLPALLCEDWLDSEEAAVGSLSILQLFKAESVNIESWRLTDASLGGYFLSME